MTSITEFFDALTDPFTWERVLFVLLGTILVYYSLTSSTINRMWGGM